MFVLEARRRASIEAECEAEAQIDHPVDHKDDGSDCSMLDNNDNEEQKKKAIEIRADHIAKIAAEMLLDLS